jgi:hypothetical protein
VQVEEVETLAADFVLPVSFPDANVFYAGLVPDRYAVSAAFQVTTYPATLPGENVAALGTGATLTVRSNGVRLSVNADLDSDGYSAPDAVSPPFAAIPDCNDHDPEVHPGATEIPSNGVDDDCNKDTPDVPTVPGGTVLVRAERHTVGTGNTPSASKAPLTGLPVLVFDKTPGACAAQLGVSWQTYKAIWWKCPPAQGTGLTDAAGVARVPVPPGNYLVIGEYDADGLPLSGDEIYLGVSVGSVAAGATAEKYLQLIVKADGKNVPAKYTTRTGSELRIIEPEYVEWSGQQELYPFIYESVGDWSVTTSVAPPPGFVADQPVLSADVNNELAVLQFTLTDVGSDWVATGVEHRIRHRGRSETVRSEVGVKLTPELARAHGVTPSGKPVGPHPKP